MADYHVCWAETGIYAGVIYQMKKDGWRVWRDRSDVTQEAIRAVAQYLMFQENGLEFDHRGKHFVMRVDEVKR